MFSLAHRATSPAKPATASRRSKHSSGATGVPPSTVRTTDLRTVMRRRLRWAAVVFVVGFALLLVGVTEPVVGILGFLVMLSAFVLALSAWKRLSGAGQTGRTSVAAPAKRRGRKHVSARQRLEERWQRRWDERGGSR